jgi:hypothetical protein
MLEKVDLPNDCNQIPGVFITGVSNTDTNNSMNIEKKFEIIFRCAYLDQEKLCVDEKSCDTVPVKADNT